MGFKLISRTINVQCLIYKLISNLIIFHKCSGAVYNSGPNARAN